MDKKHKQCQRESAAAKLGGHLQKDPERYNQEENSTEKGQKIFLYVTMENGAILPRGRAQSRQLLGRVLYKHEHYEMDSFHRCNLPMPADYRDLHAS